MHESVVVSGVETGRRLVQRRVRPRRSTLKTTGLCASPDLDVPRATEVYERYYVRLTGALRDASKA